MALVLRPAVMDDSPGLEVLHESCFGGVDAYVQPWNEDDFREFLKFSNYHGSDPFIVAEQDGEIIGFLMTRFNADKPLEATVMTIDVDPRYRNRRIASLMLEKVEELIRTQRTYNLGTTVTAGINVTNQPSRNLFSAFDYAAAGVEKDYYAPGIDAVIVKKDIPANPGPYLYFSRL